MFCISQRLMILAQIHLRFCVIRSTRINRMRCVKTFIKRIPYRNIERFYSTILHALLLSDRKSLETAFEWQEFFGNGFRSFDMSFNVLTQRIRFHSSDP